MQQPTYADLLAAYQFLTSLDTRLVRTHIPDPYVEPLPVIPEDIAAADPEGCYYGMHLTLKDHIKPENAKTVERIIRDKAFEFGPMYATKIMEGKKSYFLYLNYRYKEDCIYAFRFFAEKKMDGVGNIRADLMLNNWPIKDVDHMVDVLIEDIRKKKRTRSRSRDRK